MRVCLVKDSDATQEIYKRTLAKMTTVDEKNLPETAVVNISKLIFENRLVDIRTIFFCTSYASREIPTKV